MFNQSLGLFTLIKNSVQVEIYTNILLFPLHLKVRVIFCWTGWGVNILQFQIYVGIEEK